MTKLRYSLSSLESAIELVISLSMACFMQQYSHRKNYKRALKNERLLFRIDCLKSWWREISWIMRS
jgi:hypothetical protein